MTSFRCAVTLTAGNEQGAAVWWADILAPQRQAVWMTAFRWPEVGQGVILVDGRASIALPRNSDEPPLVRVYESPSLEGTATGCSSQ